MKIEWTREMIAEEKRSKKDVDIDWISQLPDQIIHHILSFLPERDVARSSVLSKTWNRFWSSIPISDLDFSESLYGLDSNTLGIEELRDRRVKFASFVHNSVLRQYCLNTRIQTFRLSMTYDLHSPVAYRVAQSLQMVARCGVPVLDLDFKSYFALPPSIFSAEVLTVLRLSGCKLRVPHPTINWSSLREFCLNKVSVYEEIFQNLNLTCPLVEKFAVVRCSGFERIKLSSLTKLKKVKIKVAPYDSNHVEKIEIDAPCLQILNYHGGHIHCELYVTACKNLQILKLKSAVMGDRVCRDIISKFEYLKILVLRGSIMKKINISNQQLEKLQLSSDDLFEATIDTPRLLSFKYNFTPSAVPFWVNKSSLQEVTIKLFGYLDFYRWLKLRAYLGNFNQIKLLTLHIRPHFITLDTLEDGHDLSQMSLPALPDIDHLKLKINLRFLRCKDVEKNYEALVDGLLWMCHPESILLMSHWECNSIFMRVLCKKLRHRGTDQLCCTSSNIKCWQHDLKDIQIEHCKGNEERMALTCATLLDYLKSLPPLEKIFFTFQW